MSELIEVPNENILDYHNFVFITSGSGYTVEDIIYFNDVDSTGYVSVSLGTIDYDEFVVSCEFLSGSATGTLCLKQVSNGLSVPFVTDSVSGYVECTESGEYRIYFGPGVVLTDLSMRVWANEGTVPKAYQKYGETYYEEVETDTETEIITGTLVLDYDVSQMFGYSNVVTSACMPVVYIIAGFGLGFSILCALKNCFGRSL